MFNVWFWSSSNWYVMAITIFVVQSMQNHGTFMKPVKSLKLSQGLWQTLLLGTVRGTNVLPVFFNEKTVSRLSGHPPRFYILPIVGGHSLFWVKETWVFFKLAGSVTLQIWSFKWSLIITKFAWFTADMPHLIANPNHPPPPQKKSNSRSSFPKHTWTSYTCILLKTDWSLSHLGIYIEKYFHR